MCTNILPYLTSPVFQFGLEAMLCGGQVGDAFLNFNKIGELHEK